MKNIRYKSRVPYWWQYISDWNHSFIFQFLSRSLWLGLFVVLFYLRPKDTLRKIFPRTRLSIKENFHNDYSYPTEGFRYTILKICYLCFFRFELINYALTVIYFNLIIQENDLTTFLDSTNSLMIIHKWLVVGFFFFFLLRLNNFVVIRLVIVEKNDRKDCCILIENPSLPGVLLVEYKGSLFTL